jgi:DNA-binding beta-propeller fold protein YncE
MDIASERLYALTPDSFSIQIIDIVRNKIIDNVYMPNDYQPDFMTVGPELQFAYILDKRGKGLTRVNLLTGAIESRKVLSFEPEYAVFLEQQNRLAISSPETNGVHLFNPDNLVETGMIAVGNGPEGLIPWNNLLVVAENSANQISTYDPSTFQQQQQVSLVISPSRLVLSNEQVYAASSRTNRLTIMQPGNLSVSREIPLNGKPLEMAVSENRGWIYVGNGTRGGISLIDSTSNMLSKYIDLKAVPSGIVIIE